MKTRISFRLARAGKRCLYPVRVYHRHATSVRRYFWRKFAIATWKHLLINRYPERFLSDSRTPQSLKVQMGLALLMTLLAVPALFAPAARRALAGVSVAFLLACFPFLRKAARRDPAILPFSLVVVGPGGSAGARLLKRHPQVSRAQDRLRVRLLPRPRAASRAPRRQCRRCRTAPGDG